jgi:hypothetical protein
MHIPVRTRYTFIYLFVYSTAMEAATRRPRTPDASRDILMREPKHEKTKVQK